MLFTKLFAFSIALIISNTAFAVDDAPPSLNKEEKDFTATNPSQNDTIPTLPDEEDDSRNIPQPEVRIIRKKDAVIEEYRVNGHLRLLKLHLQ